MTDKDDDLFERVADMANRIGLKGNDRRKYIHDHMTRGGYRMEPSYVPDDSGNDEDDEEDAPFFSSRRNRSSRDDDNRRGGQRHANRSRQQERGRQGGDDWY